MQTPSLLALGRPLQIVLALCISFTVACNSKKSGNSSRHDTSDESEEDEASDAKGSKADACLDNDDAKVCEDRVLKLFKEGAPKEDLSEALKYAEKLCELKKKDGCMIAGGIHRGDKPGLAIDKKKAIRFFGAGCDLGQYGACAAAAEEELTANAYGPAAKHAEKACEAKKGAGCSVLAVLYIKGNGVPKDARKGAELLQKGCDYGHKSACETVAKLKK